MNEQPEMRPNGAEFPRGGSADCRWSWSQARETAASLVADDTFSDIEIASKAGVGNTGCGTLLPDGAMKLNCGRQRGTHSLRSVHTWRHYWSQEQR